MLWINENEKMVVVGPPFFLYVEYENELEKV